MSFLKRNLKNALDEKDWTKRDMWYASAFHSMSGAIAHFSEGNEKLSKREWNNWAKDRETHPDNLRRPLWMNRPLGPQKNQFYLDK